MEIEVASIVKQMMTAGESWEAALDAHALAPPDAGFRPVYGLSRTLLPSRPRRSSSPRRAALAGDPGQSRATSVSPPSSRPE